MTWKKAVLHADRPRRVKTLALIALLGAVRLLQAQSPPAQGTARVAVAANPNALSVGSTTQASLAIDLSSVTANGTPAALGAYVIEVSFDKNVLQFVSTTGGTTDGFTAAPTTTPVAQANNLGKVIVVGVSSQLAAASATGLSQVAVLSFRSVAPGTTALTALPTSLASSGAASITGVGSSATVRVDATSRPRERQPRTVSPRSPQ